MKKKQTALFKAHENPCYEYIYVNNEKVLLTITRNENLIFKLEFIFNGKYHIFETTQIKTKDHIFGSDEIRFEEINLNLLEKEKMADRLNRIMDYCFS